MEVAGRVRFDLFAIVLVAVYGGIYVAAGKIEQLGYTWLMIVGLLGVFKLFARVEAVSDFLAWIKANLRRSWRIVALLGIFMAHLVSQVVEDKVDAWTGFSGFAFSVAGALAYMAWHCRSSRSS